MAGCAEGSCTKKRNRNRRKKKRRDQEDPGVASDWEMKQLVVRCSVPPPDAACFPVLAVARRLVHTHTSSPFPQSCAHAQQFFCERASFQADCAAFSPSPPPLIINHMCPSSPLTLQQQVSLCDAVPSVRQPCHAKEQSPFPPVELDRLDSFLTEQILPIPCSEGQSKSPTPPLVALPTFMPQTSTESMHKYSLCSIRGSLLGASEDGATLAAELLDHLKESLYSALPQSVKSNVPNEWDSILSSSLLEKYMDTHSLRKSSWLSGSLSFKRVIRKVSKNRLQTCDCAQKKGPHLIEDLLETIESFEKAGLIGELENLGFVEEACILQDRTIFYALFARLRALQEVSSLLCFMRLEMHLSSQNTWSLACSDSGHRHCLRQICDACNFHDKIKTFAWKLDKLELCTGEVQPCMVIQNHEAGSISSRIVKLLDSALGPELEGIGVISYLNTAVSLLLHHKDIFKILQDHGFAET